MPRPLRVEYPGAIHHVTARGNNGGIVFVDDTERTAFIAMLSTVVAADTLELLAYCLLGNHFHLLVATPLANLARAMQRLNSAFAQYANRRRGRTGHVFGGRYSATLVENDVHLLESTRYIALNPVRAGLCRSPEHWRWSSHRAACGIVATPSFLAASRLLDMFGDVEERARVRYRRFVADGLDA
jgi:REP element-mobilizing transposase RayT